LDSAAAAAAPLAAAAALAGAVRVDEVVERERNRAREPNCHLAQRTADADAYKYNRSSRRRAEVPDTEQKLTTASRNIGKLREPPRLRRTQPARSHRTTARANLFSVPRSPGGKPSKNTSEITKNGSEKLIENRKHIPRTHPRRSQEGRGAKPPDFEGAGNPKHGPKWSQIYQKIIRTSLEIPPLLTPLKAL